MTRGGDTRAPAGLGLWLVVSLLAHALALPLLREGASPRERGGDAVRVTLAGAAGDASATPMVTPDAAAGGETRDRTRDTERRRETRAQGPVARPEPLAADPAPISAASAADPGEAQSVVTRMTATAETATPVASLAAPVRATAEVPVEPPPRAASASAPATATAAQALPRPTAADPARVRSEPTPATPPVTAVQTAAVPRARTASEMQAPAPVASKAPADPTRQATDAAPAPAPVLATVANDETSPRSAAGVGGAAVALASVTGTLDASPGGSADTALLALLHRAIDEHKRYPSLARRQRREGVATVLFRLHPDGGMDRLELAASSGFDMLDKAALRAVAGVAPFAPATRYLQREKQFSVEVEFRLF